MRRAEKELLALRRAVSRMRHLQQTLFKTYEIQRQIELAERLVDELINLDEIKRKD
jgi:hypothetical protein